MKVKGYEIFKCDAGWRTFSFLKITTADGIIGWSEYNESFGSPGPSGVIEAMMPGVIGMDPMDIELVNAVLATRSTQSRGGVVRQAVAAIENALLDIKGKALGVPVYQLFGGKLRDRIPVYWSHCGSYRMRNPEIVKTPAVRTYDDMTRLGAEVKAKGFTGLKTNFHFRTEGFRRIAEAVAPARLAWLELDAHDPKSIALIRRDAPCPIASGETLLERRDFRPYFEAYAFDTAIVDVIWNGFYESLKIAALADVYEVNVAPHNFYGHLASAISAHFCAAVPNFRVMEIDIDGVPWRDDIVNTPPVFDKGDYILPTGPGWGVEVDEAGLRRHPVK